MYLASLILVCHLHGGTREIVAHNDKAPGRVPPALLVEPRESFTLYDRLARRVSS